ncbi:MAG: FAD-binding protein [Deltaproteobacteria bacterium]|nr:FAD-binding protein [Deltaproteobacteria bacterium]
MKNKKNKNIKNLNIDLVVIGSGGGLAAAVEAAEQGVKEIVVLEKQGILGGSAKMAQGLFACESPIQKRDNIIADRDECFRTFMRWHHWTVDPRIARAYINKSGDTIRWFQKKGVDFVIRMWYPSQKFRGFHWPLKGKGPEFGRGAELIKVLSGEAKEKGIQLMLRTSAKRLMLDSKGRISGVAAIRGGKEFIIKTRSVIIGTGTIAGNLELIKRFCPDDYFEGMHIWEGIAHHTGDGLIIAEEIGAATPSRIPMSGEGPHPDYGSQPGNLAASIKEPIAGIVKESWLVWVNKLGRRFVDETAGFMLPESGNALSRQPGKLMYTLFDDRMRQDMEESGMLVGRGWGKEEETHRVSLPGLTELLQRRAGEGDESLVHIADNWDEMARWIGADPAVLKAEIREYNSCCDRGYDAVFAKERRFLVPLRKPPYYGIRGVLSSGGVLGGIIINERMEVQDAKGKSIPGLYAIGDVASGLEARTYCGELCGSGLGFAMNSGRIAGEEAANYVRKKTRR